MNVISYNKEIGEAIAIHRGYFFSIMKKTIGILHLDDFCGICIYGLVSIADFANLESAMDEAIKKQIKDPWDNAWDSYCPITVANIKELEIAIKDL